MTADRLSDWRLRVMDANYRMCIALLGLSEGGDWSAFKTARRELVRVLHEDEAIIARSVAPASEIREV